MPTSPGESKTASATSKISSTNVDMDMDTQVKKLELFEKTFGGLGEGKQR